MLRIPCAALLLTTQFLAVPVFAAQTKPFNKEQKPIFHPPLLCRQKDCKSFREVSPSHLEIHQSLLLVDFSEEISASAPFSFSKIGVYREQ